MKAKEPKKRSKQPHLFAATGQQSAKKAKREAAQAGLEQKINARGAGGGLASSSAPGAMA